MFGIKPKTFHHWYKEELSGYPQSIKAGTWGDKKIKIVDEHTGELLKEKDVPIAKAANMGSHMTIDEKQIGKKMYTLMTNAKTGKIAFMAQSVKSDELKQAINEYLKSATEAVTSVSCDMCSAFKKLCKEVFPNTKLVIDKFHVVKHLMDALQMVRRQLKAQCLNSNKIMSEENVEETKETEKIWTDVELLERSRYSLVKMEVDWEEEEKEMMEDLFERYPVLKTAYELTLKLRAWYNGKNIGKDIDKIEKELYNWCDEVIKSKIKPLNAVRKMIERHQDDIVNYFLEGQTNAKAENMNGKIQRFLANNFGIKERDFFLYRVAGYFA